MVLDDLWIGIEIGGVQIPSNRIPGRLGLLRRAGGRLGEPMDAERVLRQAVPQTHGRPVGQSEGPRRMVGEDKLAGGKVPPKPRVIRVLLKSARQGSVFARGALEEEEALVVFIDHDVVRRVLPKPPNVRVVAGAPVEGVGPGAADQHIGPVPSVQLVRAVAALQLVALVATNQNVVTCPSERDVVSNYAL